MGRLPLAEIERIMRNAGAEKVTEGAVRVLRDSTQELGEELADDAVKNARKAGREKLTVEDIEAAISS